MKMNMNLNLSSIGIVRSDRKEVMDDQWGQVVSIIELDSNQFTEEALYGLEEFSHIDVIFHFHLMDPSKIEWNARHPRNNMEWPKVGIFSQRGKNRPNGIGVSTCKLLKVEGLILTVQALDAVDGTPVLDIKPYMAEFAPREDVKQPEWSKQLMVNYFS